MGVVRACQGLGDAGDLCWGGGSVEGREKGQSRRGWRGWAGLQWPVGNGADKNRLNNQPPGGAASALTEFGKGAAGPERAGGALVGCGGVNLSVDH